MTGSAAEQDIWEGGELLFAGGTDFAAVGRHATLRTKKKSDKELADEEARQAAYPNLPEPYRIEGIKGKKIKFVAAGAAAAHIMCIDMEGKVMTWGRNEKQQLGLGDRTQRNMPTYVPGMQDKVTVHGACGRGHTVVVTDDGKSWAWGLNSMGQTGTGEVRLFVPKRGKDKPVDELPEPKQCLLISDCTKAACGVDFTMWLCAGKLYAAGSPENGRLGDGSDHSCNVKDSSIKIMHEPQGVPLRVPGLDNVTNVACGAQHTVASTSEGQCFTWGNGGYGRLGHKEQKDEFSPKLVETLVNRLAVPENAVVAAGGTASFCDATTAKMLYCWGKLKVSGDSQMYPILYDQLTGWNIRSFACGPATFAVAAEKSAVTWGAAHNQELAYGPTGKKSAANPDKVYVLEGMHTHQVAAGVGFTLFLVRGAESDFEKFKTWSAEPVDTLATLQAGDEEEEAGGKGGAGGKRKAPAAKGGAKKTKK